MAGPGYGKSTITQFLALYHASRIVNPDYAAILAARLKLPDSIPPESLDAFCEMRFPFRVELRRYAKWRRTASEDRQPVGLATYIVRELIGKNVASNLVEDDIFELASRNPILLILDGLDEVPNKESRDEILKDCDAFIFRCSGENADLQIVMSSRHKDTMVNLIVLNRSTGELTILVQKILKPITTHGFARESKVQTNGWKRKTDSEGVWSLRQLDD